jgi:HSP20 family protein
MPALKDSPEVTQKPQATNGPKGQAPEARGTPAPPAHLIGNPVAAMQRFAEEMDRFFGEFGMGLNTRLPSLLGRGHELFKREMGWIPAQWSPRIEVLERKDHLVIRAELPGLAIGDIKVEVADDMLTIQGERKQEKKEEKEGHFYNERSYGSFYRAIPLPEGVDAGKATAEFKNGVLEVVMPAPPPAKPQAKRVEITEKK